jgi:hypothetical protein
MHKKKTKSESELTKSNKGGKRNNSGRKKANYETKTIAFRVRVEFVEPIKKMVKDYVSERLQGDA